MDDYERDRLARARAQREEEQDRREREKHNRDQRAHLMATMEANERRRSEAKRDRVESLRREGYSEGDIRSLERKRGCRSFVIGVVVLIVVVAGILAVLGGGLATESGMSDESLSEVAIDQTSQVTSNPDEELAGSEPTEEPGVTDEASATEPAPEQQIEFVSEPVVQPIPEEAAPEPETASNAGQ